MAKQKFHVVLILPSHYDADGYVIQWARSGMPSNALASVYALIAEAGAAKALGEDVEIELRAQDETNTVTDVEELIAWIKDAEAGGFLGLVGVQSNQFPRAVDIARHFRAADVPVAIGGFHVSGCKAMLPKLPPDIQEALDMGCVLYCGEAEGRMEDFIRAMQNRAVKPIYDFMRDLPALDGATVPFLPATTVARNVGQYASFDAGRGCPFQCSFCTIINVQGRKSRFRTPDDVERVVRTNLDQGVDKFFITDDNFARNRSWDSICDRLIKLREEDGLDFKILIQVDTLCHKTEGFVDKCVRAGIDQVFIGLENIDPDNLAEAKKKQNKIWEYRTMLQAWKRHGVLTLAGYILGFPGDTPEKIRRNLKIIQRELPVDLLEFFILTPLPGSEDHARLAAQGVWMDPDMNIYDLEHVTCDHPIMSRKELQAMYLEAWEIYYTSEHVETMLRRAVACGMPTTHISHSATSFPGMPRIEGVHALQGGVKRVKVRTQRRHGMPIESRLLFYLREFFAQRRKRRQWMALFNRNEALRKKVEADPDAASYTDAALTPASEDDLAALEMIQSHGARIAKTHGAPELNLPTTAAE